MFYAVDLRNFYFSNLGSLNIRDVAASLSRRAPAIRVRAPGGIEPMDFEFREPSSVNQKGPEELFSFILGCRLLEGETLRSEEESFVRNLMEKLNQRKQ